MGWGLNQYELATFLVKNRCDGYYLRWYYNGWHYWFFYPGRYIINTDGEKYYTLGTRKVAMGTGQITRQQTDAIRTIMFTREIYLLTIAGWMNIRIERDTLTIYDNQLAGAEIEFVAIIGSKEISYETGFTPNPILIYVPNDIVICELAIGTQIWACKNYDSAYPASKVYNNDETNRDLYGGLYTFNQVKESGFCPPGWHVPTLAEWQTLINYCGGDLVAGGVLKSLGITYWNAPNTGAVDTYGFGARGAGYGANPAYFNGLKQTSMFWTADEQDADNGKLVQLFYDNTIIINWANIKTSFYSVRLIKDIPAITGTIYDIDGNIYHWITIGSQMWLIENLRTTHYADGTAIPNLILNADWIAEDGTPGHDGGYCWYNNDFATYGATYGALYNWYAVNNAHGLAPAGWRVPTYTDFETLVDYIEGIYGALTAGGHLKEIGFTHWDPPNLNAADTFGFKALGAGQRNSAGAFGGIKTLTYLWATTLANPANADTLGMGNLVEDAVYSFSPFATGFSIRCMRDV